ncbi:MAG: hypothetical protein NQU46_04800 [Methanolinea sp.]|nr:hypothetical protein [Methanolinea sp.]
MRPTLKDEMEYAIWKITGRAVPYHEDVVACLARDIARETGEDPGVVSMRLAAQIKEIIWDDISHQYRSRISCDKRIERVSG